MSFLLAEGVESPGEEKAEYSLIPVQFNRWERWWSSIWGPLYVFLYTGARWGWKIGVLLVGGLVVIAGVVMIVTPGPAFVFIPLGFAILATEFLWARRLLRRIQRHASDFADKARRRY